MHIITRARLTEFGQKYVDAAPQLREWMRIMRRKQYTGHLQVKSDFPTVDFIGSRKAVFNICGNAYRLVVDMRYDLGRIHIRHVATHAEYDRLIRRGLL
jgi:mRNA interferase HigB